MNKKKAIRRLKQRVYDLELEMMGLLNRLFAVDSPSQHDADMPIFEASISCPNCGSREAHACTGVAPGFLEQSLRNQIAGLHDDD